MAMLHVVAFGFILAARASICVTEPPGALELLQVDLSLHLPTWTNSSLTAYGSAALPLKFLHIPKCGTSFVNAIIHLPTLCPGVDWEYRVDDDYLSRYFEIAFWEECPQVCNVSKFSCNSPFNTHEGIGTSYDVYKGHLVTMLRQPEQRVLSAWYDSTWDHGASRFGNVSTYAQAAEGLMTCQLIGQKVDPMPTCTNLTEEDAHLAATRLREGFAFVGILEEWDLSVCLFHKMFGGNCLFSDFEDSRPTDGGKVSSYNVSELEGFQDQLDGILYDEAKRIFQEHLVTYNVTAESCSSCWNFGRLSGRAKAAKDLRGAASLYTHLWLVWLLILCTWR